MMLGLVVELCILVASIGKPGLGILLAGLHLLQRQHLSLTRYLHKPWEAIQHDADSTLTVWMVQ